MLGIRPPSPSSASSTKFVKLSNGDGPLLVRPCEWLRLPIVLFDELDEFSCQVLLRLEVASLQRPPVEDARQGPVPQAEGVSIGSEVPACSLRGL